MTFWFAGKEDETITVNFEEIRTMFLTSNGTSESCVLQGNDGKDYALTVPGTIDDIIYEVYQHGFEDGMHKEAKDHLYQKKVEEENEPKLKGYIKDERGNRININSISSFWENRGDKNKTSIFSTDGSSYNINMPLKDFIKMLAKAQEELR